MFQFTYFCIFFWVVIILFFNFPAHIHLSPTTFLPCHPQLLSITCPFSIPKIFWDSFINGILWYVTSGIKYFAFNIIHFTLVYKKDLNFCMFFLYPENLLNSLIYETFSRFLGIFLCRQSWYLQVGTILSLSNRYIFNFFFFIAVARTSSIMLKKVAIYTLIIWENQFLCQHQKLIVNTTQLSGHL